MLKVFRDNLKYLSWILWLVIAVFLLFMAVEFRGMDSGPISANQSAAVVGGDEISYAELQRAYRQTEESYRQAYGAQFTPELARQLQLPLQVLEQLVRRRILLNEATRMGLLVSDSELQKTVLRLPVFQDPGGNFVGADQYRRGVRSMGYGTPEEFEEGLRSDLLLTKMNQVLGDNIVIGDDEVQAAYREEAEKAKVSFIRLPLTHFRSIAELAIEEVESYFQEHIEDFRLPERRAVDYLLIDADVVRQGLEASDEEVLAYYNANAADYQTEEQIRARQILMRIDDRRDEDQARQELEAIRARIEAGEDFAQLASELSEDSFTASQGGEMAPFARGQILPEVETAAFDAQAGDIVGPIKSSSAYHLLQILEHTAGGLPPYEEMQEAVRRRLLAERGRQAAEARASELSERLVREGTTSAEGLEQLAQDDDTVSFRATLPFGRNDNVPGIGRSTPFSEAAFALEQGELSEPVRVGSGWAILLVPGIEEPRLPDLAEVETEVRAALRDAMAQRQAFASLTADRDRVIAGSSLGDIAGLYEATVEESSEFNRRGPIGGTLGSNREIAEAALALDPGDVAEPILVGSEIVLFQVTERSHFDAADFEVSKEAKRNELAARHLDDLLATVIAERREELEITYDPQMSQNLGLAG